MMDYIYIWPADMGLNVLLILFVIFRRMFEKRLKFELVGWAIHHVHFDTLYIKIFYSNNIYIRISHSYSFIVILFIQCGYHINKMHDSFTKFQEKFSDTSISNFAVSVIKFIYIQGEPYRKYDFNVYFFQSNTLYILTPNFTVLATLLKLLEKQHNFFLLHLNIRIVYLLIITSVN